MSFAGRVAGLWMIAYSGSVPLGSLGAGWAAERVGVGAVMAGSAAVCLGSLDGDHRRIESWLGERRMTGDYVDPTKVL